MGFSPLAVLYISVSRVIMFLMWMLGLLSSSTICQGLNLARCILYGELFLGFDLFCFVVLYCRTFTQGNNS